MRTIAHLSDLHFGRTDPEMVAALHRELGNLRPDFVIISGDFTQRAKDSEFIEARAFLDRLPAPWLAVPGNHDIPLYRVHARFLKPLDGYKRYISEVLEPRYTDSELTIVSVNTARSLTFKGGRINSDQVERVCRQLHEASPETVRILVAHHPLDLPANRDQPLAGRARMALTTLANAGLDMILSGHLHLAYLPETADKFRIGGHTALLVQAGTAVSTRSRGEVNSFNLIRTEPARIAVTRHCWELPGKTFEPCATAYYVRKAPGWIREVAQS